MSLVGMQEMLYPIFVRQGRSKKRYKAGYINRAGQVVIEPIYDYALPFAKAWLRLGKMARMEQSILRVTLLFLSSLTNSMHLPKVLQNFTRGKKPG